jgi:hypothetical protein
MVQKINGLLALSLFLLTGAARADFIYSGQATGARITVEVVRILGDTGALPSSGGLLELHLPSSSIPPLLSTGPIDALTEGVNGTAHSAATVADVDLTFGTNHVTANLLEAQASAVCSPDGVPELSGSSTILGLTINGQSIVVTGEPNQTIQLPDALVILNEQTRDLMDASGAITVNALHIQVNPIEDFVFSSAHADISCPVPEPSTLTLLTLGIVGLFGYAWRRQRQIA